MRRALVPLLLFAAACSSAPAVEDDYVLVLLKTGPRTDLSAEERGSVFAGHFANMQRLADERKLLVAGPFGQLRHDPALRGIFVLDVPTKAAAAALAATDPGVVAGVFVAEPHALQTDAPLRAYLEHELAIEAAAKAEGRVRAPGEGGRTYVLLTAEDGAAAEAALAPLRGDARLLLLARLDGSRAFAILDAVDVPAAEALLGERRARLGPYVLDAWFGSGELVRIPALARGG
jgi:uncharacterized protein YciI